MWHAEVFNEFETPTAPLTCMRGFRRISASIGDGCTCSGGLRLQTGMMRSLVCSRAKVESERLVGCGGAARLAWPALRLDQCIYASM